MAKTTKRFLIMGIAVLVVIGTIALASLMTKVSATPTGFNRLCVLHEFGSRWADCSILQ